MKVQTFTTRLLLLITYSAYFPPDHAGKSVNPLPEDKVKEILHHAMPNMRKKKMVEQGYNYLDNSIQQMTEFFETRIENLGRFDSKKDSKNQENKSNKKNKKGDIQIIMLLKERVPRELKLEIFLSVLWYVWTHYQ